MSKIFKFYLLAISSLFLNFDMLHSSEEDEIGVVLLKKSQEKNSQHENKIENVFSRKHF